MRFTYRSEQPAQQLDSEAMSSFYSDEMRISHLKRSSDEVDTDALDDKGTGLVDRLSYYFARTFKEYSRCADGVDEDEEQMLETHNEVLEETDGAISCMIWVD